MEALPTRCCTARSTVGRSRRWASRSGIGSPPELLLDAASGSPAMRKGSGLERASWNSLVIDPERGVQMARTARRMPEELWHPELTQNIRATPWKHIPDKSAEPIGRSMNITERMIDAHGPTDDCRKCSTGYGSHSAACRQRFGTIQADFLREKLEEGPCGPRGHGGGA
eukprot:7078184-Pyramimonas_sp.AAC.1